jgi:ankyrin repeat protein
VDSLDALGRTPLICSAISGNLGVFNVLLARGANMQFRSDSRKWSALHHASQNGNSTVIKFFLDHGFNPWEKAQFGATPVYLVFGQLLQDMSTGDLPHRNLFDLSDLKSKLGIDNWGKKNYCQRPNLDSLRILLQSWWKGKN